MVALGFLGPIIAGASALLGGAGRGAADERQAENTTAAQNYRTQQGALLNLLGMEDRGKLERAELGLRAPTTRANQSVLASLMQTIQPTSISHPRATIPEISGGFRGALANLTPGVREAGGELERQALMALMSGSDVPEETDFVGRGMVDAPEYKDAGFWESLASGAGLGGGLLSQFLPMIQGRGSNTQARLEPYKPTVTPRRA